MIANIGIKNANIGITYKRGVHKKDKYSIKALYPT